MIIRKISIQLYFYLSLVRIAIYTATLRSPSLSYPRSFIPRAIKHAASSTHPRLGIYSNVPIIGLHSYIALP